MFSLGITLSFCSGLTNGVRSIPQDDSYSELEVTKRCMESIIEIHSISPDFLTVLYAAGVPPRDSEEGFGHPIENWYEDGSFCRAGADGLFFGMIY
jgi:hypothetical protein